MKPPMPSLVLRSRTCSQACMLHMEYMWHSRRRAVMLSMCCVPEQAQRQHVDNLLAMLQEGLWQHDYPRVASAAALALPQLVRYQIWLFR